MAAAPRARAPPRRRRAPRPPMKRQRTMGPSPTLSAVAGANRDWSRLPEDLLVSVLWALHVAEAVRSGAVRAFWHAAYATFRRLSIPSPRQPPCLLYASDGIPSAPPHSTA
ncbi:hypothetical protein BAE44_0008648 [Dichanthelium oligosanthes]|uniref:F-box domain-containing protein n=1 Tax=Dichanthelium oligosanthes TaxID=888268 RepID=A0A1E5VZ34_9POAL|nr:hypothetical protein BAE44_0008648 [Dichanthelium oligosanthes]